VRRPAPLRPQDGCARLAVRTRGDRAELWTESAGSLPDVYGERWTVVGDRSYRSFEPARSKLAAAIDRGWAGPLPQPGERWLYLGAASGTTASHVADLVGPSGRLYAVERSVRPFVRLLAWTERWPNVLPILADAREPENYGDRVPIVQGIYADVAQPDQVDLVRANAAFYLDDGRGALLLALKTSSMGRSASPAEHLGSAEAALAAVVPPERSLRLAPFFRSHYLLGGRRGETDTGGRPSHGRRGDGDRGRPLRQGRRPERP
jgi:fibrillarin-like rRNA methylase